MLAKGFYQPTELIIFFSLDNRPIIFFMKEKNGINQKEEKREV